MVIKSNLEHRLREGSWEWHFCAICLLSCCLKTEFTPTPFPVATGTHSPCAVSHWLPNDHYQPGDEALDTAQGTSRRLG